MTGDDYDLRVWRKAQNLAERGETFRHSSVVRRKTEILQDDRRLVAAKLVDRRRAVRRRQHLIIFEAPAQLALDTGVVLDDQ
jgi:hypothetical protein